jgi:hypothetical protein
VLKRENPQTALDRPGESEHSTDEEGGGRGVAGPMASMQAAIIDLDFSSNKILAIIPGLRHSTAFEVVPITTYNTVRGFGVSDQELFTNKIIMFMAMLLLLLLPTTTETGTGRQHSDYVAPPPLNGQTVGSLSTASVQRTTTRRTRSGQLPTHPLAANCHILAALGNPHILFY